MKELISEIRIWIAIELLGLVIRITPKDKNGVMLLSYIYGYLMHEKSERTKL